MAIIAHQHLLHRGDLPQSYRAESLPTSEEKGTKFEKIGWTGRQQSQPPEVAKQPAWIVTVGETVLATVGMATRRRGQKRQALKTLLGRARRCDRHYEGDEICVRTETVSTPGHQSLRDPQPIASSIY